MASLCLLEPRLDELIVLLPRPGDGAPSQGSEGCADSSDTPGAFMLAPMVVCCPAGLSTVFVAVAGVVASPGGLLRWVWPQHFHGRGGGWPFCCDAVDTVPRVRVPGSLAEGLLRNPAGYLTVPGKHDSAGLGVHPCSQWQQARQFRLGSHARYGATGGPSLLPVLRWTLRYLEDRAYRTWVPALPLPEATSENLEGRAGKRAQSDCWPSHDDTLWVESRDLATRRAHPLVDTTQIGKGTSCQKATAGHKHPNWHTSRQPSKQEEARPSSSKVQIPHTGGISRSRSCRLLSAPSSNPLQCSIRCLISPGIP